MANIIERLHPVADLAPGPGVYPGMFRDETALTPVTVEPVDVDRHGVTATYMGVDVADVYEVTNNGRTFLHVLNGGASDCVLLIGVELSIDTLEIPSRTVSVPAGAARFVGPFPPNLFGHQLSFAFDEADGIEFAALRPSFQLD